MADCQSRGQRLANIYNENEQAELNALIIDIGGTDRAFWLGMIEDGETPDKFGIKVTLTPVRGFFGTITERHLWKKIQNHHW